MFSNKLKRPHYLLAGAAIAIGAALWWVADEEFAPSQSTPVAGADLHEDAAAPRHREPQIQHSPAGRGEAIADYLPTTWGGGGGLGGFGQTISRVAPDRQGRYPDPRLDDLFTDPA